MAVVSPSSLETLDPKSDKSDPSENPNSDPASSASTTENPNPEPHQIPNPSHVAPPPPAAFPSFAPSYRPLGMPPAPPQYSTFPNPMYQNLSSGGIQPPGVPGMPVMRPGGMYPPPPYGHAPNPYMPPPPGVAPNGISHYPGSYQTMARPGFPPRPMNPIGVGPQMSRPPIPGMLPIVRPVVPIVAPTEKPQTTVYVGKIAASVGNDFMQSLLLLCGPVKSWKRAQDPSNGTPKGFGFCEFEAAEGVLRALRLLTKLSIDGQELSLNINQATREYLERYVEKKTEREKIKETENNPPDKESESAGAEKDLPKADVEETKNEEDSTNKKNHENQKFGIVTDQDVNLDKDALEKITAMIDERIKNRPLPPPPPIPSHADASARSNSEKPSKSRDGDSDIDITRNADDKNDDELTSEAKAETNSPDRGRRHDRRSRDRDRERDPKREKDRELDRYERERERERIRREKERDTKVKEAERIYRERVKEWEDREKDKERHRRDEKEREKERQRKRRNMILKEEDGSEDEDEGDSRKRRRRSNMLEEKRRKRQREKEEDMYDRVKEEEEIAEAKKKAVEEQKRVLKSPATHVAEESKNVVMQEDGVSEHKESSPAQQAHETVTGSGNDTGNEIYKNSSDGQISGGLGALPDTKQNNDAPTKKLGFGLVGSGKRTTVQSVFHEEDDENVDDKKMRPLVPIDYSTEELQAVQTPVSSAPANLVAAAEFAKRLSGSEKLEMEKERNGRPSERTSHRERDRNDNDNTRHRNESKDKVRDRSSERERGRDRERDRERERERDREEEAKPKAENKKLLDAKQLIDMIPKTKEELFAYEINWAVYDEHELHERMRPWISKKINDFLGEEEATLVDYIVSSTKDHVQASKMLELLQAILDDEAEMFVLKMWRMLIFEIKKVETGLSAKART